MTTEDTPQMPLFSPEDEKETQKVSGHPHTNGTPKVNHKRTGFEDKTLWDWLQLLGILAIPLVVAGATIAFGFIQFNLATQQHDTDQKLAVLQHISDQKIANQQFEADKQSTMDQQQADTLQKYIDNIQDLLLNHNLLQSSSLDPNNSYYDVAIIARARTLTALQGLDPQRKGRLLIFLHEAELIGFPDNNNLNKAHDSVISLIGADLIGAELGGAELPDADLSRADLSRAQLNGANLSGAYFYGTDFDRADLSGTNLSGADLIGSNHLTQKQLDQVKSCKDAKLNKGYTCHNNK